MLGSPVTWQKTHHTVTPLPCVICARLTASATSLCTTPIICFPLSHLTLSLSRSLDQHTQVVRDLRQRDSVAHRVLARC